MARPEAGDRLGFCGKLTVALLVAAMASWMFSPFLPFSPLLVLSLVGTLALTPFLDLLLLLFQMRALRQLWRNETGTRTDGRVLAGTVLVGMAGGVFPCRPPRADRSVGIGGVPDCGEAEEAKPALAGLRVLGGQNAPCWI